MASTHGLTQRQVYLACSVNPTYGGACSRDEVRAWKRALAGHVIHERRHWTFTAFNSRGHKRSFFYAYTPKESREWLDRTRHDPYIYNVEWLFEEWDYIWSIEEYRNARKAAQAWASH